MRETASRSKQNTKHAKTCRGGAKRVFVRRLYFEKVLHHPEHAYA